MPGARVKQPGRFIGVQMVRRLVVAKRQRDAIAAKMADMRQQALTITSPEERMRLEAAYNALRRRFDALQPSAILRRPSTKSKSK